MKEIVVDNRFNLTFRHTDYLAIVRHAKEDVAAETVQERADRLERVVLRAVAAALELHADVLTDLQNVLESFFCHRLPNLAPIIPYSPIPVPPYAVAPPRTI